MFGIAHVAQFAILMGILVILLFMSGQEILHALYERIPETSVS